MWPRKKNAHNKKQIRNIIEGKQVDVGKKQNKK